MRLVTLFAPLLAAWFASATLAQSPALPVAPEFRLGDGATPLGYRIRLSLDPKASDFSGEALIDLAIHRSAAVIWLNGEQLTIDSAEVVQSHRSFAVTVIPGPRGIIGLYTGGDAFAVGPAVANIRYRGRIETNATEGIFKQAVGDDSYIYSSFEDTFARRAYPCFDEPGWKTPWQITLDVPAANVAVSSAPETFAYDIPDRAGWRRHVFAATPPLPSYLIAVGVGPFEVIDGGTAGVKKTPLRYIVPQGRGSELAWTREVTPRILEALEDYFGIPFPFDKLDSIAIPQTIGFGAMENVGLITYASNLMVAKPHEETGLHKRRYAFLASHEIAHMWFGNMVTMAWWDDLWLNESFASWMEDKILFTLNPEWNDGWSDAFDRAQAIGLDRLDSTRRVKNPVLKEADMAGLFDAITYEKGGQVLSMFEAWLTPERFRAGVQVYLKRHAWGSATSTDFIRALGEAAGRSADAQQAFAAFIEQPGVPRIDVSLQCQGKNIALRTSQQRLRPLGSRAIDREWTTPACFRYGVGGKIETQCAEIRNAPGTLPLTHARTCPDWVLGNASGVGYYVTTYDAPLQQRLMKNAAKLPGHELIALISDTTLLAKSGLLRNGAALDWADTVLGLGNASPVAQRAALELLRAQRDAWLDAKHLRQKQQIIVRHLQPLAQKLGWQEKSGESDSLRSLRRLLLPFVAETEKSGALRNQAREIALQWLSRREAISSNMAPAVLDTAARFADSATFATLESAALANQDPRERKWLLGALANVRDRDLLKRAYALTTAREGSKERISGRDLLNFLQDALDDEHNRKAAFAFLRSNYDAIVAKLPADTLPYTMKQMGNLCTGDDRVAFQSFFADRAGKFQGGQLRYAQALERIELCIAARDAQHPVATVQTGGRR